MQLDRTAPAVARLESEAHFEDCWRARELGRDKDGRLVMLDHVGGINFDGIHKLSHDDILRNYAHRFERIRRRKLALAREIGVDAYYHTTVVDLKGLGLGDNPARDAATPRRVLRPNKLCGRPGEAGARAGVWRRVPGILSAPQRTHRCRIRPKSLKRRVLPASGIWTLAVLAPARCCLPAACAALQLHETRARESPCI